MHSGAAGGAAILLEQPVGLDHSGGVGRVWPGFHMDIATHGLPCLVRWPGSCATKRGSGGGQPIGSWNAAHGGSHNPALGMECRLLAVSRRPFGGIMGS
jgi:hypothetical protein